MIDLKLHLIEDLATRESLKTLLKYLDAQEFLKGDWTYLEFDFAQPVENYRFRHNLGFVPTDFIQSYFAGTGTVLINWDKTDRVYLDLTATGSCSVRGFIGAHA